MKIFSVYIVKIEVRIFLHKTAIRLSQKKI